MGNRKRKLTAAEKAAKEKRREEYMTIFVNGKQKRVKRPPTVDGLSVEEFIRRNADPIWLHQNEMWEELNRREMEDEVMEAWELNALAEGEPGDDPYDPDDVRDLPF